MPNVDIDESAKKASYTLPTKKTKTKKVKEPKAKAEKEPKKKPEKEPKVKAEKEPKVKPEKESKVKSERKSGLLSNLFRHSDRKSNVPALDLPSVEQDLLKTNETQSGNMQNVDPLHVPSMDLPKLDVALPSYDRPEVDMTTGQIKQTSEFTIPTVDLPPIPNFNPPESNAHNISIAVDPLKVPNMDLPELQLTLNEQEKVTLPEIHIKTGKETTSEVPLTTDAKVTIADNVTLGSPVNDIITVQTDEKIDSVSC